MTIKKTFIILTHLMALLGFAALTLSGYLNSLIVLLFSISILTSFYSDFYNNNYGLSSKFSTFLGTFVTIFLLWMLIFLGYELFIALIYFIIFIQIVKLVSYKEIRDYQQIILLSFFQILAAAVTTSKIYFGALLLVYILVAICTVMVFNIHRESFASQKKRDLEISYKQLLGSTLIILISIILIGSVLFTIMPRFKGSFVSAFFIKREELRTGFSDQVNLGKVGEIKSDNSPVMRVKFINSEREDLPQEIYWRGVALNDFDGFSWKIGDGIGSRTYKEDYNGVVRLDSNRKIYKTYIQEVITQPLDTDVLFAANFPVGYKNVPFNRVNGLNDSYFHYGSYAKNTRYFAYSHLRRPTAEELNRVVWEIPDWIKSNYSYSFNPGKKVIELASNIYDQNKTVYQNVVNLENYLQQNLDYTRVLERGEENFPIDQFLFENKKGHCEYFASSMVVILREMGIPSRLITGFIGGEFNAHGDYFLIRESNAHAWVEVFFPSYGWISFDPTPSDDSNYADNASIILSYVEYIKYRWSRYVVDFDRRDQISIYNSLRSGYRKSKFRSIRFNKIEDYRKPLFIMILVIIVFYILRKNLFIYFRSWGFQKQKNSTKIYNSSLKLLRKEGFIKDDGTTATEFASNVIRSGGSLYQPFYKLTNLYLKMRFDIKNYDNDVTELRESYRNLKTVLKIRH